MTKFDKDLKRKRELHDRMHRLCLLVMNRYPEESEHVCDVYMIFLKNHNNNDKYEIMKMFIDLYFTV